MGCSAWSTYLPQPLVESQSSLRPCEPIPVLERLSKQDLGLSVTPKLTNWMRFSSQQIAAGTIVLVTDADDKRALHVTGRSSQAASSSGTGKSSSR